MTSHKRGTYQVEEDGECGGMVRITASTSSWLYQLVWGRSHATMERIDAIKAALAEIMRVWRAKEDSQANEETTNPSVVETGDFIRKADSSDDESDDAGDGNTQTNKNVSQRKNRNRLAFNNVHEIEMNEIKFKVKPLTVNSSIMLEARSDVLDFVVTLITRAQRSLSNEIFPKDDHTLSGVVPDVLVNADDSDRIKWNRRKCSWHITYKMVTGKSRMSSSNFKVDTQKCNTRDALMKLLKSKLVAARAKWQLDESGATRYA